MTRPLIRKREETRKRDKWAIEIRETLLAAKADGVSVQLCIDYGDPEHGECDNVSLIVYDKPDSSFGVIVWTEDDE